MARDLRDESLRKHKEWLGFLQPVGLVVSPPAMVDADCHVNTDVAAEYQRFVAGLETKRFLDRADNVSLVKDLRQTLFDVFGWTATDLVPADDPRAADLVVPLHEYGETLRPTFAVLDDPKANPPNWVMLIQELPTAQPFDAVAGGDSRKWQATPQVRFERLLRETGVSTGLLSNGCETRIVYSPRGESPGH